MPNDQGFKGFAQSQGKELGTTSGALISLNSLIPFFLINSNWALTSYGDLLCLPGNQNGSSFAHSAVTVPSSGGTALSARNSSVFQPGFCVPRESRQGEKEELVMKRKQQGRGICWASTEGWISRLKREHFGEIKLGNQAFSSGMTKFLWTNRFWHVQPEAFQS